MKGTNTGEDFNPSTKDHDEILNKIKEIKDFERRFPELDLSQIKQKEELIELDEKIEEFDEAFTENIKQPKKRKINLFDKFKKKSPVEHELNPTVFHLRINNEKLENIDIKKPIVKERKKKIFSLTRFKKDKEQGKEKVEKSSKLSKIKGAVGRIKMAIPSRQKKSKDEDETTE